MSDFMNGPQQDDTSAGAPSMLSFEWPTPDLFTLTLITLLLCIFKSQIHPCSVTRMG